MAISHLYQADENVKNLETMTEVHMAETPTDGGGLVQHLWLCYLFVFSEHYIDSLEKLTIDIRVKVSPALWPYGVAFISPGMPILRADPLVDSPQPPLPLRSHGGGALRDFCTRLNFIMTTWDVHIEVKP